MTERETFSENDKYCVVITSAEEFPAVIRALQDWNGGKVRLQVFPVLPFLSATQRLGCSNILSKLSTTGETTMTELSEQGNCQRLAIIRGALRLMRALVHPSYFCLNITGEYNLDQRFPALI